jgi:hypothetical protein
MDGEIMSTYSSSGSILGGVAAVIPSTHVYDGSKGYHGNSTGPMKIGKKIRFDKWTKKMIELGMRTKAINDTTESYIRSSDSGEIIAQLGNINPIYNQRPKKTPIRLLLAINGIRHKIVQDRLLWQAGLFYKLPSVAGKRRSEYRLTLNGVKLLDHWADKYKSFRPFLDAYMSAKSRKKIISDCVDFQIGIVPLSIMDLLERDKKEQALIQKEREFLDDVASITAAVRYSYRKQNNYGLGGNHWSWIYSDNQFGSKFGRETAATAKIRQILEKEDLKRLADSSCSVSHNIDRSACRVMFRGHPIDISYELVDGIKSGSESAYNEVLRLCREADKKGESK